MSSVNLSFVIGGRGERPLGEKLPDGFTVRNKERRTRRQRQRNKGSWLLYRPWKLNGAIELHRLAVEDYEQLEKQKDEITSGIINSACSGQPLTTRRRKIPFEGVSQPPLPLIPRSHHCSSHASIKTPKQRSCSSARVPIPTRRRQ